MVAFSYDDCLQIALDVCKGYLVMSDNQWPPEGTRVRIRDGSEAHGDEGELALYGEVWMVELDEGYIWPILHRHEIEVIKQEDSQ